MAEYCPGPSPAHAPSPVKPDHRPSGRPARNPVRSSEGHRIGGTDSPGSGFPARPSTGQPRPGSRGSRAGRVPAPPGASRAVPGGGDDLGRAERMKLRAAAREKMRRLLGALLISLGTAVFSGAVAVLVDGLINGKPLRWWYITAFTVAGLLLSGGGAWLLATLKTAVGIGVATTDAAGDLDRYQDEADSFARFGEGVFTALTSLLIPVSKPHDLLLLRSRVLAALRTLTQVHRQAATIGLLFQGRHQVGFHLGKWLNVAGRRIDLYADARDGTRSHFLAVRLTPAIRTAPRPIDIVVYTAADGSFTPGQQVTVEGLRSELAP